MNQEDDKVQSHQEGETETAGFSDLEKVRGEEEEGDGLVVDKPDSNKGWDCYKSLYSSVRSQPISMSVEQLSNYAKATWTDKEKRKKVYLCGLGFIMLVVSIAMIAHTASQGTFDIDGAPGTGDEGLEELAFGPDGGDMATTVGGPSKKYIM